MGGWRSSWACVKAVTWKDLVVERRTKASFNAVVFLAATMLLLFGFALGAETETVRQAAAGVVWLTVLLSGVLTFNRSYEQELEDAAIEALLLYPVDKRAIFVGKFLANLVFLLLLEVLIVGAAVLLYDIPFGEAPVGLTLVLILGTIGFAGLGTFYGAITSRLRARELMMPLLLFPMMVPLLMAAVEATGALLSGDPLENARTWVRVLVAFDIIFLVAAFLVYEYAFEA